MGGSLRSGMDHVPGTGPHRVGMVTPSVESLHNPTQFGFDSTLDAVSRHCEKKLRCPIQSCLDVIKHIYIYICSIFLGDEQLPSYIHIYIYMYADIIHIQHLHIFIAVLHKLVEFDG